MSATFMAAGRSFASTRRLRARNIDVAPTIMHLLACVGPVDGQVLENPRADGEAFVR